MVLLATNLICGRLPWRKKATSYVGGGADLSLPLQVFLLTISTEGVGLLCRRSMLGVGQSGAVTFTTGYTGLKEIADFDET